MPVRIETVDQLPNGVLKELDSLKSVFGEQRFLEQLLRIPAVRHIAETLDEICLREGIIGFHYTRADADEIRKHGLLAVSGEHRRREFIERHGHRFTPKQLKSIKRKWQDYFSQPGMSEARDHRLWFNFTHSSLGDGGATDLLKYYGGEVVNMPLCDDHDIAEVLKTIGQSMVVECALNAAELTTFSEIPWGSVWLSSYHVVRNSEAHQHDVDAFQQGSIGPDQIVSISFL
jgi:hypothetical protein